MSTLFFESGDGVGGGGAAYEEHVGEMHIILLQESTELGEDAVDLGGEFTSWGDYECAFCQN